MILSAPKSNTSKKKQASKYAFTDVSILIDSLYFLQPSLIKENIIGVEQNICSCYHALLAQSVDLPPKRQNYPYIILFYP